MPRLVFASASCWATGASRLNKRSAWAHGLRNVGICSLCDCINVMRGLEGIKNFESLPSVQFRKLVFDSTTDLLRGKTFRALRGKRSVDWDWDTTQRRPRQRPRCLVCKHVHPQHCVLRASLILNCSFFKHSRWMCSC